MSTDKLNPDELEAYLKSLNLDDDDFDDDKTTIGELSSMAGYHCGLKLQSATETHRIELSPLIMGRDARNHLPLPSRKVSRFHALIYKFGKHYFFRDLNSTNGSYLNRVRVSQAILRPGDQLQLGDQELNVLDGPRISQSYESQCIVIFVDLQDSTRYSEKYGETFTSAVQDAFSRLEDKVLLRQGCPVKRLGDGLMIVFGHWPVITPNYSAPDQALAFAHEAIKTMRTLKAFPGLHLRVGIHFGPVSISDKDDLDVFGDSVNLASRLEEANKHYPSQILMSEAFVRALKSPVESLREMDTVFVQGKAEPVTVFTWDATPPTSVVKALYSEGLALYRQGHFEAALALFEEGHQAQDPLATGMVQRIREILASEELQAHWQGVWSIKKI